MMVKKLILIGLLSTLTYADTPANLISVSGIITDISQGIKYNTIRILLDDGSQIRAKVYRTSRLKEKERVLGRCSNYKYGEYQSCSLSKIIN